MAREHGFWDDPDVAGAALKKQKIVERQLTKARELMASREDLEAAMELISEDLSFLAESVELLLSFEVALEAWELETLLSGELDSSDALLTIQAGAGGTESCDWALMLWRMYERFSERMGWTTEVVSVSPGDSAGCRSVECKISGEWVYGYLRSEHGVHRLIRISPFDSGARRHTSFASVQVSAIVDDSIEIAIQTKDLRVDTYRASGAGGQHVNKTDSAVRITHEPTGIVVQSQSQRSQHQNREQCMQLLRAKLYAHEQRKRDEEQQSRSGEKVDISFGSQIRTYTLHPFKLVKDHRSLYETSSAQQVLDGENLLGFIKSALAVKLKGEAGS